MKVLVTAALAPSGASVAKLLGEHPDVEVQTVDARNGFPWATDSDYLIALGAAGDRVDHILLSSDPELAVASDMPKVLGCPPGVVDLALEKPYPLSAVVPVARARQGWDTENLQRVEFMEYLPGHEYSVDAVFKRGEAVAVVARVRLRVEHGICRLGRVLPGRHLLAVRTRKLGAALALHGGVNIQFKEDAEGLARLIDINARFGGGVTIPAAAGVNLPCILADLAIDGHTARNVQPTPGVYAVDACWKDRA